MTTKDVRLAGIRVNDTAIIKCNYCNTVTTHWLKAKHEVVYYNEHDANDPWAEDREIKMEGDYRFWICSGCDTATMQWAISNDTDILPYDKDPHELIMTSFYPERKSIKDKVTAKHYKSLSKNLYDIYKEVIAAYNNKQNILRSMGIRALVEGICVQQGISGKEAINLQKKIDLLGTRNIVPGHIANELHTFRFMGNEAAHELSASTTEELQIAIKVVEDLLNFLYEVRYELETSITRLADVYRNKKT